MQRLICLFLFIAVCHVSESHAADLYGLSQGTPKIRSAGPIAFGPDGILFIGDPQGAAVFAVQTGDKQGDPATAEHHLEAVSHAVGEAFDAQVEIADLAVNPLTGNVFLLVSVQGQGVHLAKVQGDDVTAVPLKDVHFARKEFSDAPTDQVIRQGRRSRNPRGESITDIAWVDGEIIVSGLRQADSPSGVRTMVFPFNQADKGASLEFYHGAHGTSHDDRAIQTFVPFIINGEPNLLAGFVCTPLVRFPVSAVKSKDKISATTVAELGNRNRPLDMFVYEKDGQRFLLLSNSARGIMKISTRNIEREDGITEPVRGTAGQEYETIESWQNVEQMDKLNEAHAVLLVRDGDQLDLKTVALP